MSELQSLKLYNQNANKATNSTATSQNNGGLLGGLGYLGTQLAAGAVGVGEGAYDFTVGGIAKIVGNDKYAKRLFDNEIAGDMQRKAYDKFNPNKGWQFAGDVASGIGQSTVGALVAVATGGGGLAAGLTIGIGAAGMGVSEAYNKTGQLGGKEFVYGAASGLVEGGLEGVTGVAGKVGKQLARQTARSTVKTITRKAIAKDVFTNACGEFIEESLSEAINPYLQRGLDIDKNADNATINELLRAGFVGFVSGALMSSTTGAAVSAKNVARGDTAIKNGTVNEILAEAKTISKYVTSAENSKLVAPAFREMTASLKAYDGQANKTGVLAKMYLGEVQRGIANVHAASLVKKSADYIQTHPKEISAWYKDHGALVTEEDIITNKDGIVTRIAVEDAVGHIMMPDMTAGSLDKFVAKGKKELEKKGAISEETNNDIVDAYRQMERLNNGGELDEAKYTFAQDYKLNADDLQRFSDGADFMRTRGLLAKDGTREERDSQNRAIRAAISTGKTTVAAVEGIQKLAKKAGLKVRFENIAAENGTIVNGDFNGDTIRINLHGTAAFERTAVHEFIHHLAKSVKANYEKIKAAVEVVCKDNKELRAIYDNAIKAYKELDEKEGATHDDAYYEEEAICKVCEQFILEQGGIKSGKNAVDKSKQINLSKVGVEHIRTLRDFFRSLKERVKSYMVKGSGDTLDKAIAVLDEALKNNFSAKKSGKDDGQKASKSIDISKSSDNNINVGGQENVQNEFRRIQNKSKRLLKELEHSAETNRELNEYLRGRYTICVRELLGSDGNSSTYEYGILKHGKNFTYAMHKDVSATLFHDAFESIKPYIKQNELVDLHDNYDNCKCYLSNDGLQGFAIEKNGNLVSVFNAITNEKSGFVEAVKGLMLEGGANHLDCYGYLAGYYEKVLGFKPASIMDYNMEYDHHNIAERFNRPDVAFLVRSEADVEIKRFAGNQYDEAVAYQQSLIQEKNRNSLDTDSDSNQAKLTTNTKPTIDKDIRYSLDKSFAEQVDDVINKEFTGSHLMVLENTPSILQDIGVEDNPFLISVAHTKTAMGIEVKNKNLHHIKKEVLIKLPQKIANPAIVMNSATRSDSIVMLIDAIDEEGNPVVCAVKIVGGRGNYNEVEIDANIVLSVYGKNKTNGYTVENFIEDAVNDNRLLYWNKKMSQSLFDTAGLSLPNNILTLGSNTIIRNSNEKSTPNSKNSEYRKSYAGQFSKTADYQMRDRALNMLIEGKPFDEIVKETGWFLGADGYMRYEIDDSKMTVAKNVSPNKNQSIAEQIKLASNHVEYLNLYINAHERNIAAMEDAIKRKGKQSVAEDIIKDYRTAIKREQNELRVDTKELVSSQKKLNELLGAADVVVPLNKDSIERLYNNGLFDAQVPLGKLIDHKELFAAYPQLKTTPVVFRRGTDIATTYLNANAGKVFEIEIAMSAFYDEHNKFSIDNFKRNIIHEVQHAIQTFEGFTAGTNVDAAMEQLRNIAKEQYRANPDNYNFVASNEEEFADEMAKRADAYKRYLNTYGEQEARSTEERINLTAEERRNYAPFSGNSESVFAEDWRNEEITEKNAEKSERRLSLGDDKVMLTMPSDEKSGKIAAVKESLKDTKISFLNTWVNAQAGIEKYCKKLGISNIEATTNYARASHSAANYMIEKELRPVFEEIKKKNKGDTEYATDFMAYLLHWHNTDRMADEVQKPVFGEDVGVEESKGEIARIDAAHPEFKKFAEKVWAYSQKLLNMQLDNGLITEDLYNVLTTTYPHYVPTYRDTKGAQTVGAIKGKGFVEINRSIKRAKGSDLEILPIDVMLARRTMQVHKAVRVNEVAKNIRDAAVSDANQSRAVVVGSEKIDGSIDFDKYRPKDNQISFFDNGEVVTIAVSNDIFSGFNAFHADLYSEWNNPIMNFTTKWNTTFKKLVTAYNPFFTLRNALRDLQEAGLYTKSGWGKFLKNFGVAYKEIATDGKRWQEYREAGGLQSSVFDYDKGYKRSPSGFKKAMEIIETVNIVVEQAPRLAEFISSRENGADVQTALLNAGDVTVNFGRSGTFAKKLNSTVIPFLNPSIQGFDKLLRSTFGRKTIKEWTRLIARAFLLGIAVSMLNDMLLGDDEEYKSLSQYTKENYFLLKIGKGKFLKLPKGRVSSILSQTYYISKQAARGEKVDWKEELSSARSAISPTETASRFVWSPFTDVASNRTWYGSEIEGAKFDNVEPRERYDENTSAVAIAIGKTINYSPKKINYLLDQYSGVIGDILLPLTTNAAEPNVFAKNFTIDSDISNAIADTFYDEITEVTYAKNEGSYTAKAKLRYYNKIRSKVNELNLQKKAIQNSDLSDADKRAQVKAIQVMISAIQKNAVENASVFEDELLRYDINDDNFDVVYLQAFRNTFGAQLALEDYDDKVYAKAQLMNSTGIDYETYFDAYFTILAATSDKDKEGNTIAGSRKAKVTKYVSSLKGLTKLQRAILLASAGYVLSSSLKNQVKAYGKTLSDEDKTKLFEMCGIK